MALSVSDSSPRSCSDHHTSRRSRSMRGSAQADTLDVGAPAIQRPPQQGLDAGQQLPGRERLDDIVIRPHL